MTSQRQVAGRASCASMWRFKWQQCKLANPGLGELQNDAVTVCRVTGLLRLATGVQGIGKAVSESADVLTGVLNRSARFYLMSPA